MSEISGNVHEQPNISRKEVKEKIRTGIKYLKRYVVLLIIAGVIGAVIGVAVSTFTKPKCVATSTFVLDEKGSGGAGAYAGLAGQLGISLGGDLGMSGSGLFAEGNIIELYKSRTMLAKTLLTPVQINGKKELLIDRYIDTEHLRDEWQKSPKLQNISFDNPAAFTIQHDSIITAIVTRLNKKNLNVGKLDKKLNIITVTVSYPDELFAKLFDQALVQNVNDFYVTTKTKKSTQNVKVLKFQADSVRSLLNRSLSGAAASVDPNANPYNLTVKVPSQKKQIDVQTNSALYTEIVKNLALAQITMRQETPLIQIIDQPVLPLRKEKIGLIMSTVGGGLLGIFLMAGCLIMRKMVW